MITSKHMTSVITLYVLAYINLFYFNCIFYSDEHFKTFPIATNAFKADLSHPKYLSMQSYIIRTHNCDQGSENDSRIGALWLLHFCHAVIILIHCICRKYDTFGTVEAVECFIKETHTETPHMLLLYISVYAYFAFHVV